MISVLIGSSVSVLIGGVGMCHSSVTVLSKFIAKPYWLPVGSSSLPESSKVVSDIHTGIDAVITCLLAFKLFFFPYNNNAPKMPENTKRNHCCSQALSMGSGLSHHANCKKNIPVLQCSLYSSQINFSRRDSILGAFVEEEN